MTAISIRWSCNTEYGAKISRMTAVSPLDVQPVYFGRDVLVPDVSATVVKKRSWFLGTDVNVGAAARGMMTK